MHEWRTCHRLLSPLVSDASVHKIAILWLRRHVPYHCIEIFWIAKICVSSQGAAAQAGESRVKGSKTTVWRNQFRLQQMVEVWRQKFAEISRRKISFLASNFYFISFSKFTIAIRPARNRFESCDINKQTNARPSKCVFHSQFAQTNIKSEPFYDDLMAALRKKIISQ